MKSFPSYSNLALPDHQLLSNKTSPGEFSQARDPGMAFGLMDGLVLSAFLWPSVWHDLLSFFSIALNQIFLLIRVMFHLPI